MNLSITVAQTGFIAVTVIYYGLFLNQLRKALRNSDFSKEKKARIFSGITIGLLLWLVLISVLAAIQFFNDFSVLPPKFFMVLLAPLILVIWVTSTKTAREILVHVPVQNIVYLQSFRIFVEILLWALFVNQLLPIQMTFEGLNFDVLTGISAIVIGFIASRKKSRTLLLVWNIGGLALLVNIVTIAILSTLVPFRVFMNEPANTIVTQFPIIWLPGVLVPLAYWLHLLSLRQLSILKSR
jgi:hypothetical protein